MRYKRFLILEKVAPRTPGAIYVVDTTRERFYRRWGYVIRDEVWECNGDRMNMKNMAYNLDGHWIGDSKLAYRLANKYGVTHTEPIGNDSSCTIGFSEKEERWYGWSHRAISSFGIGSEVKIGHCAFKPSNKEEFKKRWLKFWEDSDYHEIMWTEEGYDGEAQKSGMFIRWRYSDKVPNERLRGTIGGNFQPYPETWGKGEWTAKNLREAKQMAIDFAKSVN